MNVFKQELDTLTRKYINLKTNGNFTLNKISFMEKEITLNVDETRVLQLQFAPTDTLSTEVSYVSENPRAVSVDKNGIVTGLKAGESIVTATSKLNPELKASINVKVNQAQISKDTHIAKYEFEENGNDSWKERHAIRIGSAARYEDGKVGKAIRFDGTEASQVELPDTDLTTRQGWTVSYWIKLDTLPTKKSLVMEDKERNSAFAVRLGDPENRKVPGFRVGKRDGDVLSINTTIEAGEWNHITWVQDHNKGLTMYLNGKATPINTWTKGKDIKLPIEIIGGQGFEGLIDEVHIYNKALSPSEVLIDQLSEGLNITETEKELFIDEESSIDVNLITQSEDKTVTYVSDNEEVVQVDKYGNIRALKRGKANITVSGGGFTQIVTVNVSKKVPIKPSIPRLVLPDSYTKIIDERPEETDTTGRYLGQPDMVQTKTGRLIIAYPKGHGKGPVIMQISDDNGETWRFIENTPDSWVYSQETPTLYKLQLANGTERIMMINSNPGWGVDKAGNRYGWNTSYSDDNGETWSEYKHWHPTILNGQNNDAIVAMASLVQLKDESGNYIQKWMGVYHTFGYVSLKTYLTFDENGNEQWSKPEPYLSEYRNIESLYQICEVGMFRSPDGNRIVALARSQSHNHLATLFYSDDEGQTWSKPEHLPASLAGERHKVIVDPISKRLVITFREISYDTNNNGYMERND